MITGIDKPHPRPAAPAWSGTAVQDGRNLKWYYWPRHWLHVQEQDERNPRCWMNAEPSAGARRAVQKAIRAPV
jgi:hypothetical protein